MIRRRLLVLMLLMVGAPAMAQLRFREGVHYQVIPTPQRADAPADKIEVAEVFSYGCTYCYQARGDIAKLAAGLPADAAMTYVHASFLPTEAWPMFQRAYYTARKLGIFSEATHEAMFKAVWETGEVPLLDAARRGMRKPPPTIEDAAKFYARVAKVKAADFLKVANSPEINKAMQQADALVKQWRIPGTPALVVNGRYLVEGSLSQADTVQVVNFLIALERTRPRK